MERLARGQKSKDSRSKMDMRKLAHRAEWDHISKKFIMFCAFCFFFLILVKRTYIIFDILTIFRYTVQWH